MLGIAPVAENRTPSNPPMAKVEVARPVAAKAPAAEKRTMLGIPGMGGAGEPVAPVQPAAVPGNLPAKAPNAPAQASPAQPSPLPAAVPKQAAQEQAPAPAPAPKSQTAHRAPSAPATSAYGDDFDRPTGPSVPIAAIVAAGAGVILLVAAAVLVYFFVLRSPSGLLPQLYPSPDGTAITAVFSFPSAPAGATIQVAQMTAPVQAGQARVDIPSSVMSLGSNELELLYTEPGKPPERHTFQVLLRHLVKTDLSGLQAEPPSVTIQFRVAEGLKLSVEGNQVQTTAGTYAHVLPLATLLESGQNTADTAIGKLLFQITDDSGATEQGQHVIAVPLSKLQIDRPAPDAVVDVAQITCAGIVDRDAAVQVNGQPVGATAVGFSTIVPLPNLGKYDIKIIARSPGKAPSSQTLSVTRIESLATAIKQWSEDLPKPELDYPTLGRDTNAQVGKKIRLSGRIVNINTEKGVTVFLLYVADGCPAGARCAAYTVFRGETDAGLQSWVDVYGTVRGTSAVDLPSGGKLDVPALDASFVAKSIRKAGKRG
jgi:hypothetical protein